MPITLLSLWIVLCSACGGGGDGADRGAPVRAAEPVARTLATDVAGTPAVTSTAARRKPRRLALLVGIADYQHFTSRGQPGRTDLEGPLNDVERMRATLRRWGFGDADDTRVLTDRAASRASIERALEWLATRATDSADVVLVYYSGHGSFTGDMDGDEARVTPGDTLDEALVPWDARDIHDAHQILVDDRIREVLGRLGTSNVTVIIDACYSGTATRGPGESGVGRAKGPLAAGPAGPTLDLLDRPGHTLLTAAAARQVARELPFAAEDKVFGIFTYHLTRALDGALPNARYDDVMRQVRAAVSGEFVQQTPQLEGDRSARLFNVGGDVPRRAFALVTPLERGRVRLDIGAIHGVRDSARFDVFAPGETAFRDNPIAQLQVESIEDAQSIARVMGEGGAIPAHARAVMARVPLGAKTLAQLPVWVAPAAADDRVFIERLDFVRVVEDSGAATAHVFRDAGHSRVRVNGIVLAPLDTESDMCGPLARAFAIASFDLVQNPQPPPELDVRLRLVLADSAPPESRQAMDTAYIGQHYDIYARIEAPANSRFFLSVAVAGYASDPLVLHPRGDGLNQPFPLNSWERIFRAASIVEPAGLEILKVVVDSNQFDLRQLVESFPACGVRGRGDRWKSDPSPVTGWTAVAHRVLVHPRR